MDARTQKLTEGFLALARQMANRSDAQWWDGMIVGRITQLYVDDRISLAELNQVESDLAYIFRLASSERSRPERRVSA